MVIVGVAVMSTTLLADIGGSKSRFALGNPSGALERVVVIHNDTVTGLDAAVAHYLEETGARPRAATMAVAGAGAGGGGPGSHPPGRARAAGPICQRVRVLQVVAPNGFLTLSLARSGVGDVPP